MVVSVEDKQMTRGGSLCRVILTKCNDTLKICNDRFEEQNLNFDVVLALPLATLLFS